MKKVRLSPMIYQDEKELIDKIGISPTKLVSIAMKVVKSVKNNKSSFFSMGENTYQVKVKKL